MSRRSAQRLHPAAVVALAWVAGAVPFSNIAARRTRGVDLRDVGSGTVSGTSLYRVAGFTPLAIAGVCDVAKGAVGPLLAGADRPELAAVAAGAGVAGHNWSPFLSGAGGRGLSPAIGALLVRNWEGSVLLLGAMAGGRMVRHTGLAVLAADVALVPFLRRRRGREGAMAAAGVVVPLLAKRLAGNRPAEGRRLPTYASRLLFDRDTPTGD